MNTTEIKELFDYNSWANHRLLEAASQLTPEQYHQDLKASHGGIHGTLLHIVAAQKVWLSRWLGAPDTSLLREQDVPALSDLTALWEKVSADTGAFLAGLTDGKLQEPLTMTTTTGKQFTNTFQQMMQHVVNHSSAHRGQVAALMRQLGIKPPATDLIAFYRRQDRPAS